MNSLKRVCFIFIFLLAIQGVLALDIQLDKTTFNQGETLFATLQGNILESISKSDIRFLLGNVEKPLDYDVAKIGGVYYIYAILPYNEDEYTLRIQDVYFKEQNQFKTEDLEINFFISNLTSEFNVNPGFFITAGNLSFDLYNNLDFPLEVNYGLDNNNSFITLPAQETTTLNFVTDNMKSTFIGNFFTSSSQTQYSIPVHIVRPINDNDDIIIEENSEVIQGAVLEFSQSILDETIILGNNVRYDSIKITNVGDEDSGLINIDASAELEDIVVIETLSIDNIAPGEEIIVFFNIDALTSSIFEGQITATSEYSVAEFEVVLNIGEEVEQSSSIKTSLTCADLGGNICAQGETCDEYKSASDNSFCCVGSCAVPGSSNSEEGSNFLGVMGVAVLLLLLLIFIGYRMKKIKKTNTTKKRIISG